MAGLRARSLRTEIRRLRLPGEFPVGLGVPPLQLKILLESDPPKSIILGQRLAVLTQASQGIPYGPGSYTP